MAFTERYVTSAAAGGGDGSSGTPWTLAEALTSAVAGDRVNIQSDAGYSLGADTVSNSATSPTVILFRGYNSTIGDLEGQGWNSDGTLDTTNFPVITLTGVLTPAQRAYWQNISFTGSINGQLISSTSVDNWGMVSCSVSNTSTGASAACIRGDNDLTTINCDFTTAGTNGCVNGDKFIVSIGCRFKTSAAGGSLLSGQDVTAIGCTFIGFDASATLGISHEVPTEQLVVVNCTFYKLLTAIALPNAAASSPCHSVNNHITDCGMHIDNRYDATANNTYISMFNRTRDNGADVGLGEGIVEGEVTTDTGDHTTDYVDAPSDDLRLIAGAPGAGAALKAARDIGAHQQSGINAAATFMATHRS